MEEDFGMMNQAYHVSRTELILWINTILKLKLHCIEQLGTGAVHCQLLDYYFPGSLSLSKVSWKAKTSWEFVANFKVLQQGFDNLGLKKKIDVEKLTAAKYQDNLEFAQWIKRFCDVNGSAPEGEYNGPAKRNKQGVIFKRNLNKYKSIMNMAKKSSARKESSGMKVTPPSKVRIKRKKTVEAAEKKKQALKDRSDIQFVLSVLKSESTEEEMIDSLKAHFGLKKKVEQPKNSESEEEVEDKED
jgi:RP/EB family microtubule-associated protein